MGVSGIIVAFILAAGVFADHPHVTTRNLQDDGDIEHRISSSNKEDQLSVYNLHDTSDLKEDVLLVEIHQDGRRIANQKLSLLEDQLPLTQENTSFSINDTFDSVCYPPFENIGSNCYYFVDKPFNFADAQYYCENLSNDNKSEIITLAMLDYDNDEDIELLAAVAAKDTKFWIGGKSEDGINWVWVDYRDMNILAPYWYADEPNQPENKCVFADVYPYNNVLKSYLFDHSCEDKMNFICQIEKNPCPKDFRHIGNHCYFLSGESDVISLSWTDARDYCQSILVPDGYHADLAVLGLPDQDDYHLMNTFAASSTGVRIWLGASHKTDCNFKWVDNRTFPDSTFYWYYNEPDCGMDYHVCLHHVIPYHNRKWLDSNPGSDHFPFVCQMFQDV